jgi:hypothetical protein
LALVHDRSFEEALRRKIVRSSEAHAAVVLAHTEVSLVASDRACRVPVIAVIGGERERLEPAFASNGSARWFVVVTGRFPWLSRLADLVYIRAISAMRAVEAEL